MCFALKNKKQKNKSQTLYLLYPCIYAYDIVIIPITKIDGITAGISATLDLWD